VRVEANSSRALKISRETVENLISNKNSRLKKMLKPMKKKITRIYSKLREEIKLSRSLLNSRTAD
jgi:hypothetical protein